MNYTIEKPKGIDHFIQKIQSDLFKKLGWENLEMYGRVYKNPSKAKGITLEAYQGKKEYKDVFTNDKKAASVFFIDENEHKTTNGIYYNAEVKIVFMVNLAKLYPDVSNRADTDAQVHCAKLVGQHKIFTVTGIEKGIETIFKGINTDGIKLTDLQPYHVFAIVGNLKYQLNYC